MTDDFYLIEDFVTTLYKFPTKWLFQATRLDNFTFCSSFTLTLYTLDFSEVYVSEFTWCPSILDMFYFTILKSGVKLSIQVSIDVGAVALVLKGSSV